MSDKDLVPDRMSNSYLVAAFFITAILGIGLGFIVFKEHVQMSIYSIGMCFLVSRRCIRHLHIANIRLLLLFYVLMHFALIVFGPRDNIAMSGAMMPIGLADYIIFYRVFYILIQRAERG